MKRNQQRSAIMSQGQPTEPPVQSAKSENKALVMRLSNEMKHAIAERHRREKERELIAVCAVDGCPEPPKYKVHLWVSRPPQLCPPDGDASLEDDRRYPFLCESHAKEHREKKWWKHDLKSSHDCEACAAEYHPLSNPSNAVR